MVSRNERERLVRVFDKMNSANDRQRDALTRMVVLNTGAMAALAEIAYGELKDYAAAAERALQAIKDLEQMAAATGAEARELLETKFPTTLGEAMKEEQDDGTA